MSTIDQLNRENRKLQDENDPYKEELTLLFLKRRTEQLNDEQQRRLDDLIKIIDKRISENIKIIIENKKQITKLTKDEGSKIPSPMLSIYSNR